MHYRVWRDDRNWVTVDEEEYFENLVKLVEVHSDINNCIYQSRFNQRAMFEALLSCMW